MQSYLNRIEDYRSIATGSLIRRVGSGKDQQGRLVEVRDNAFVLTNVIDLIEGEFAAENGLLTLKPDDQLYIHTPTFENAPPAVADKARRIIQDWPLFQKETRSQKAIIDFVESAYSPGQIIDFTESDAMKNVFVPIQQKFKIGRFVEKINPRKERVDRFQKMLDSLQDGKHLTYLAFIPRESVAEAMFYSIGTQPHREILVRLQREEIAFQPNHGGHIKIVSATDEPKKFIVDAGSNDFGVGLRTHLATAEMITDALAKLYPDYEFQPVPGRDAYGVQQSY